MLGSTSILFEPFRIAQHFNRAVCTGHREHPETFFAQTVGSADLTAEQFEAAVA